MTDPLPSLILLGITAFAAYWIPRGDEKPARAQREIDAARKLMRGG